MRSLIDKTMDLGFGFAALTRDKVQEFVDEMVKRGEAAREESGTLVDDILSRGQAQRQEVQSYVQREVSEALAKINMATRDDLARLDRRVQELEVLVEDLRGGKPVVASEKVKVEVLPPEVAPPAEPAL